MEAWSENLKEEIMFYRFVFILLICVFCFNTPTKAEPYILFNESDSTIVEKLNSFKLAMQNNMPDAGDYNDWILEYLDSHPVSDSILLSDCYYYTGTYYYLRHLYTDAIMLLQKSLEFRLAADSIDDIYARTRTNLALSYMYTGNHEDALKNLETALATREMLFGTESPNLVRTLLNLSAIYIDMSMYERALSYSLRGIRLGEKYIDVIDRGDLLNLYNNSGVSYANIFDYSRAIQNFELMYSLSGESEVIDSEKQLRSYNSIAVCNYELGNLDLSDYFFCKALDLIDANELPLRLINSVYENYAFYLADNELFDEAERYFLLPVELAEKEFGKNSRDHIIQLLTYAYFLIQYNQAYTEAEDVLNDVLAYVNNNMEDSRIRNETFLYYSRLLYQTGRYSQGLKYINRVISDSLGNSVRTMTSSFIQKSKILFELYRQNNDIKKLEDALAASEKAIWIIEETRLKIQQDESRRRVSGRYMDAYDMTLAILYRLFSLTGSPDYGERAFIISEKSKAAGLLAATRTNRTMSFHLPEKLARLERNLLSDLRDYNEAMYEESAKENPNSRLIDNYRLLNLRASARYDSLVQVFKNEYPRYYNLRHNTSVSNADDIRKYIGGRANFIEYYLSDSLLYIFLLNRERLEIQTVDVEDSFKVMISEFRGILTNPVIVNGSTAQYRQYIRMAYDLYNKLVLPVKDYFISDRLIISADDILSYIPFEALISKLPENEQINYRGLDYLLHDYEIIYEYSATILSETTKSRRSIVNDVLSFAPDYKNSQDLRELMMSRQFYRDSLTNIPGAREEAIYINKLLGGELYIDDQATESAFKRKAGEGDIIHLAMHTLLNDNDPMYSKMIFSMENDTVEDGLLNTFEVYNIPFESKMLFLSSCNTGAGNLQSGEGVMSLARGFFYSGSPCVIMSLWEVDDHSGSDIVKAFYNKLRKGLTKSKSLKMARTDYLANADQIRSHPYFWSTLVIMGNDGAVYFPYKRYMLVILLLIIFCLLARYYYRSGE
ncbi:MAG: CHAT domain-containing tetratricopeptide repeat protein [Bacteroidales bacterium]|nr:CHAT domain-containing tetratricopeptide repeat protein [Bacteroidales bacterium]